MGDVIIDKNKINVVDMFDKILEYIDKDIKFLDLYLFDIKIDKKMKLLDFLEKIGEKHNFLISVKELKKRISGNTLRLDIFVTWVYFNMKDELKTKFSFILLNLRKYFTNLINLVIDTYINKMVIDCKKKFGLDTIYYSIKQYWISLSTLSIRLLLQSVENVDIKGDPKLIASNFSLNKEKSKLILIRQKQDLLDYLFATKSCLSGNKQTKENDAYCWLVQSKLDEQADESLNKLIDREIFYSIIFYYYSVLSDPRSISHMQKRAMEKNQNNLKNKKKESKFKIIFEPQNGKYTTFFIHLKDLYKKTKNEKKKEKKKE